MNTAIDRGPLTPLEQQARADLPYSGRRFERWVRARLVEHWQGECYWAELDRGDFGLLRRPFHSDRMLVADIVALISTGAENLTVIAWAVETSQPLDDVVYILTVLDVNAHRVRRFPWLLTPLPPVSGSSQLEVERSRA
jgi:hypothetical protein